MKSGSGKECEWTCEGGPKITVGADGNSDRYQRERMSVRYRWLNSSSVPIREREIIFLRKKSVLCIIQDSDGVA